MPIKKEKYHPQWKNISHQIKEQAGWKCEGTPRFSNCQAIHNQPHPETSSKVILTTAHMDQDPQNNDPANLRALCQRCHLDWDRPHNIPKIQQTLKTKKYGTHENQYTLKLNKRGSSKNPPP